jgi:hypothetical protein
MRWGELPPVPQLDAMDEEELARRGRTAAVLKFTCGEGTWRTPSPDGHHVPYDYRGPQTSGIYHVTAAPKGSTLDATQALTCSIGQRFLDRCARTLLCPSLLFPTCCHKSARRSNPPAPTLLDPVRGVTGGLTHVPSGGAGPQAAVFGPVEVVCPSVCMSWHCRMGGRRGDGASGTSGVKCPPAHLPCAEWCFK